jgi:hypothetical protein
MKQPLKSSAINSKEPAKKMAKIMENVEPSKRVPDFNSGKKETKKKTGSLLHKAVANSLVKVPPTSVSATKSKGLTKTNSNRVDESQQKSTAENTSVTEPSTLVTAPSPQVSMPKKSKTDGKPVQQLNSETASEAQSSVPASKKTKRSEPKPSRRILRNSKDVPSDADESEGSDDTADAAPTRGHPKRTEKEEEARRKLYMKAIHMVLDGWGACKKIARELNVDRKILARYAKLL